MQAFIVGIENDTLLIERSYGKPWAYQVKPWEPAYDALQELRARKQAGQTLLGGALFEPIEGTKALRMVDIGL